MEFDFNSFIIGNGLGVLGFLLFLLNRSYFKVEEGHLATVTAFGASKKDPSLSSHSERSLRLFGPGGHWKWPWEVVIPFSTMERVIDLSGEQSGKYAMAADGTILRLDSKIRFFPKVEECYSYLFDLKNPSAHIKEMFTCILRNEIANFRETHFKETENTDQPSLGSYSTLKQERKRLNEQVESITRLQIGGAYGIQFSGVDLIDIVPPQELESALNGIQNAHSESETLYSKAEADARQRIVAAEQGVEIARIRAESIKLELETLAKMIKNLTQEESITHYLFHRQSELTGNSKMLFIQKGGQ